MCHFIHYKEMHFCVSIVSLLGTSMTKIDFHIEKSHYIGKTLFKVQNCVDGGGSLKRGFTACVY